MAEDALDRQLTFDLLAAELRLELADASAHTSRLAERLRALFPQHVTVEPASPAPARSVTVDLGGRRLVLRLQDGGPVYESVLRVHGIDLGRQRLDQQAWLTELLQAIRQHTEALRASEQLLDLL